MAWDVELHDQFGDEFLTFASAVQDEILALIELLKSFGPSLGRPHCDTLKGSKHPNMKELRFSVIDGEWRVAFAFDPERVGILLVGGNKCGQSSRRFYRKLIKVADERFDEHLSDIKAS